MKKSMVYFPTVFLNFMNFFRQFRWWLRLFDSCKFLGNSITKRFINWMWMSIRSTSGPSVRDADEDIRFDYWCDRYARSLRWLFTTDWKSLIASSSVWISEIVNKYQFHPFGRMRQRLLEALERESSDQSKFRSNRRCLMVKKQFKCQ